jgi:uncharacterized membrane protein YedE/YeeE
VRDTFASQAPWFVAGPLLGLCVVAVLALVNGRLGVVGGFSDVVDRVSDRSFRLGWKGTFLLGLIGGGLLWAVVSGGRGEDGYGWLTRTFSDPAAALLLLAAGILIGFGAKTAGGCTAGNGLSGNAFGSRAALAATMTFMAVAVAASFVTKWIWGAAL